MASMSLWGHQPPNRHTAASAAGDTQGIPGPVAFDVGDPVSFIGDGERPHGVSGYSRPPTPYATSWPPALTACRALWRVKRLISRSAVVSVVTSSWTNRVCGSPSSPVAPCRTSLALSITVIMGPARRRPARIQVASVRQQPTSVTWCGKRRTAVGHQPEANARRPAGATAAAVAPG
ncbi:hypothetical protein, partial [Streptomyces sp. NPDC004976]